MIVNFNPNAKKQAFIDKLPDAIKKQKRIIRQTTAEQRGYDSQWRRVAKLHVKKNPFCKRCGKLVRVYKWDYVVDHEIPLDEGGEPYADDNLQTLCKSCHKLKTDRDKLKSDQLKQ